MSANRRLPSFVLCLATAMAVLGGVFHAKGQAVRVRPVSPATTQATPLAPTERAAQSEPASDVATASNGASVEASSPGSDLGAPVLRRIAVPNVVGLRLTYAANRIERRGLRIEAVNEDGHPVDLTSSYFYRVVRQNVRRGATLVPGDVVEVIVRDRGALDDDC